VSEPAPILDRAGIEAAFRLLGDRLAKRGVVPSPEATVTTVTPVGNEPIALRKALTSTAGAVCESVVIGLRAVSEGQRAAREVAGDRACGRGT
jgi:hypothetical protein